MADTKNSHWVANLTKNNNNNLDDRSSFADIYMIIAIQINNTDESIVKQCAPS